MQNEASNNDVLNIPETQDQGDNDCSSSVVSTISVGSSINDNNGINESSSANCSGSSSVTTPRTDDPITPTLESDIESDGLGLGYDSDGNKIVPGHQIW